MILRRAAASTCVVLCLSGCDSYSYRPLFADDEVQGSASASDPGSVTRRAAAELVARSSRPLDSSRPIASMPFVDLAQPELRSTLGSVVAERLATGLAESGYKVERSAHVLVSPADREPDPQAARTQSATAPWRAQALLVGSYARGSQRMYVHSRLVDPADQSILAAWDFELPLDGELRAMLADDAAGERPVPLGPRADYSGL